MCLPTGRKVKYALRKLICQGAGAAAVVVLFSFVILQGALSAHAATHDISALDQCSLCHTAGSSATPAEAAAISVTTDYSNAVHWIPPSGQIPSLIIPSYLAGRSPPTSL